MQVTYLLTTNDYRRGIGLYRRRKTWSRWAYRFGMVFVASLTIFIGGTLIMKGSGRATHLDLVPLVLLWIFWVFFLWVSPYLFARSQFRGSRAAGSAKAMETTGEGLSFQSEHGNSQLRWSLFVGWAEEKEIFALFTSPAMFVPVPKGALTAEQINEFRELLRQNIVDLKR
jgi:YcxB-like protein